MLKREKFLSVFLALLLARDTSARTCGSSDKQEGKFVHVQRLKSTAESCSYDLNLPLDAKTKLFFQKEPACIEHSIIIRSANTTFGPFCSSVEDNGGFGIAPVIANAKRLSTIEEATFTGPVEVEIKPTSERRTRLRLLFKWEKVEQCKLSNLADFDESFRYLYAFYSRKESNSDFCCNFMRGEMYSELLVC